jgi:hypothetical protein
MGKAGSRSPLSRASALSRASPLSHVSAFSAVVRRSVVASNTLSLASVGRLASVSRGLAASVRRLTDYRAYGAQVLSQVPAVRAHARRRLPHLAAGPNAVAWTLDDLREWWFSWCILSWAPQPPRPPLAAAATPTSALVPSLSSITQRLARWVARRAAVRPRDRALGALTNEHGVGEWSARHVQWWDARTHEWLHLATAAPAAALLEAGRLEEGGAREVGVRARRTNAVVGGEPGGGGGEAIEAIDEAEEDRARARARGGVVVHVEHVAGSPDGMLFQTRERYLFSLCRTTLDDYVCRPVVLGGAFAAVLQHARAEHLVDQRYAVVTGRHLRSRRCVMGVWDLRHGAPLRFYEVGTTRRGGPAFAFVACERASLRVDCGGACAWREPGDRWEGAVYHRDAHERCFGCQLRARADDDDALLRPIYRINS